MDWSPLDLTSDPDAPDHNIDPGYLIEAQQWLLDLVRRERPAWHARAACRGQGPDKWFPDRGKPSAPGVEVCETCPVRAECRAFALAEGEGVWAGTSKATRRAMRRSAA